MSNRIYSVVAYPGTNKDGNAPKFDMEYYLNSHMPLVANAWKSYGMKDWTVAQYSAEDALDGKPPKYSVLTTIYWENLDDFKAALGGAGKETAEDVPNFTDVSPEVWVGRETGKGSA